MSKHWTLDQALATIRLLQPTAHKYGYHIGLGGGVLNTGFSAKDLDLMILPLNQEEIMRDISMLLVDITKSVNATTVKHYCQREDNGNEYGEKGHIRGVSANLAIFDGCGPDLKRIDIFYVTN